MILSVLFSLAYILASGLLHLMFSSLQLLSRVRLFVTPWTAAHHASLSITNSRSLPKLMSIESVMPTNHLIPCCPLLLLPSIFPSIRVFSNESALCIRWPKYWSFSFNISPSNEHPGLISFRMNWLDLLAIQGTLKNLLQHHSSKASTLCNPLDYTPAGSSVHGIIQARILEWITVSSSRGSSQPKISYSVGGNEKCKTTFKNNVAISFFF